MFFVLLPTFLGYFEQSGEDYLKGTNLIAFLFLTVLWNVLWVEYRNAQAGKLLFF